MSQKFKSEVELQALNNATTDTDKFLVSDSGVVKYRTGAQILSDLGVSGIYVPYTGATGNVDLGTHTLSSYNLIVNHTSGSGVAASITKGGSGEALTINKTSGSGNAMSVTGGLTSLVDLTLSSIPNATTDTDRFIVSDGGAIKYRTGAQVLSDIGAQSALTNPITGTGTTNRIPKFTGATSLGNSNITDTGNTIIIGSIGGSTSVVTILTNAGEALRADALGNVGIGTGSSINAKLEVNGDAKISDEVTLSNYSNGVLSVNETGLIQVEPTFKNLSLGESYANIVSEKFFREGFDVYPTDAGYQYAKLIQQDLLSKASLLIIPQAAKEGVLGVNKGSHLDVVRATTATRVNSDGLIESVASNVPRLDYSNGTCPSILVEPQRTNLALRSQELDNGSWTKSSGTMTANATISPDGTTNAEEWTGDGGGGLHDFYQTFTGASTTTSSIYVKKNTAQFVYISLNWQSSGTDWATGVYDLDNLTTATFQIGTVTSPIASIKDVGNGWRRITLSVSTSNNNLYCMYGIANSLSPTFSSRGRIGFTTSASFYAWGAQFEAGSYATSYIPTTSASVTRNADLINKTGISSLIGQTEGTVFVDCKDVKVGLSRLFEIFNLSNTGTNMFLNLSASGALQIILNGSTVDTATGNVVDLDKVIFKYTSDSIKLFNNGALIGSYSGAVAFSDALDTLAIGGTTYATRPINGNIELVGLWKTALTDQECINLTTI